MKNQAPSYPNILQAIGLTAIVMTTLYLFSLTYYITAPIFSHGGALFLSYTMAMITSLWIIRTYSRIQGDRKTFAIKMAEFKTAGLITIATLALLIGIIYPVSFIIPISQTTRGIFLTTFPTVNIFTFLALVIAAPIFEELIFRGILLDGLLKNYNTAVAIIMSSILFGVFHVNPLQITSAFIGGLFMGWIYYRTRNLSYCILIHCIVNLLGFTFIYRFGIRQLLDLTFVEVYGIGVKGIVIPLVAILIFAGAVFFIEKIGEE